MINVENFYWVLYHTLLKPTNLDCRYYYPFGTTDNISEGEFSLASPSKYSSHVLFHFDQEPIDEHSGQAIYHGSRGNYHTTARILANSERSRIKKNFCRQYHLLDWYFFYHGFAALDWYRDMVYIDHDPGITHPFLSFNNLVRDQRSYRMSLTARLIERDIIDQGLVSFRGTRHDCLSELTNPETKLLDRDRELVNRYLLAHPLPRWVDHNRVDSSFSARIGPNEYQWRQRALFHVVNETVFYGHKLHLTEKIFQPIVCSRPFILVAAPGNLSYLKSYGFKTFSDWVDESYDTIVDPGNRLDAITNILTDLSGRSQSYLDSMWQDMRPVLEHNKRHFFTDFRRIIVDEMVDNFDTCIRIWNNGRVDGRDLPRHPDLAGAKRILLR